MRGFPLCFPRKPMITRLHGLVAAAHTPFHCDGSLAPEVVALQASHLARNGVEVVFITGTTGEWQSLTSDERLRIYQEWASAGPANGLAVVAHVGGNCIEDAKIFTAAAADFGFQAVAALAPCYFKPNTVGLLIDCCAAIAAAAPALPFYYYDIPALTGVRFDMAEFLIQAQARIPNLAGIKFTNDDVEMYKACLAVDGGRFDLPWGIDEMLLGALGMGAKGAVGSTYNFAAPLYHALMVAFEAGDLETAAKLQSQAVRLVGQLAGVGYLGAAKAVMGWLGVPVGPARLPLGNPSAAQLSGLRAELEDFEWFGPSWPGTSAATTADPGEPSMASI